MIHHISFDAHNPAQVASALATLLGGFFVAFPANPGSYLVTSGDEHGTGFEIHPLGTVLQPGLTSAMFAATGNPKAYTSVHVALSIEADASHVRRIADREGWQCAECSRGGDFSVIELWIENRFLIEVMPPAFAAQYRATCRQMGTAHQAAAVMTSHAGPTTLHPDDRQATHANG